jgi:GDP-D-mannose 3',5'-epimerase
MVPTSKLTEGMGVKKICIGGAGGFIGSHLAKRLKNEGHWVRAVDWKENEYMEQADFCDEFVKLDLRDPENCKLACAGCDWVFNLAADMGGMGFIQSNHSRILYNSTMIRCASPTRTTAPPPLPQQRAGRPRLCSRSGARWPRSRAGAGDRSW